MKIRLKINVPGMFHNIEEGVRTGDVVDIDDENAVRYCNLGYAEPVTKTAEKAVAREERRAEKAVPENIETTGMGAPLDEPPHQVNKAAAAPNSIVRDAVPKSNKLK